MTIPSYPVIMNPVAGGGRLIKHRDALEEAARLQGSQLVWWFTRHPHHGTELAAKAAHQGSEMVFSFGGDGSYNEVARGLVGSSCALGVLPGGTASVLVHELGIPRVPAQALTSLLRGADAPMHVGRTSHDECFLLMLSAGPDAALLGRLNPSLKKFGGRCGIAAQGALELAFRTALPVFRVTAGDQTERGRWVVVGNAKRYGGAMIMTPGADVFSAGFEVIVLRPGGRLALLAFLLAFARGRHLDRPDVVRLRSEHVRIEMVEADEPTRYQIDGDLAHDLPVEIENHPETLVIRLPEGSASAVQAH